MTRVLARRTVSGLVPADEQARAIFGKVAVGTVGYVDWVLARNPKQHALLFAMLNLMVDHAEFPNTEAALLALKLATGHVDYIVIDKEGTQHMVPKSISYANMTGPAFAAWFESAVQVVATQWIPGVKSDELRAELEQMVGA